MSHDGTQFRMRSWILQRLENPFYRDSAPGSYLKICPAASFHPAIFEPRARRVKRGGAMTHLAFNTACSLVALLATSAFALADDVRTGSEAYGDWQTDAPGIIRNITVGDLPLRLYFSL